MNKVLTAIAESPYYSQLLDEDHQLSITVPKELTVGDTSLRTALGNVIPENIMAILDSDFGENKTSGIAILIELEDSLQVKETPQELRKSHQALMTIHRGMYERIVDYTSRMQEMVKVLQGTRYKVSQHLIVEQWRSGLGPEFIKINEAIDILQITPLGWE